MFKIATTSTRKEVQKSRNKAHAFFLKKNPLHIIFPKKRLILEHGFYLSSLLLFFLKISVCMSHISHPQNIKKQ
jgi:hypothetical protein